MQEPNAIRTHADTDGIEKSASWSLLAAGFLSQACPSAAPLFHSCAMLVSLHKTRRIQHSNSLK